MNPNPQVSFVFTEDNVPIVDPRHLSDIATFEQLYLISKILGEALPLKLVSSKCLTKWKLMDDVSLADMGNGFYLIKFFNILDRNTALHCQSWFVEGQIFRIQLWEKNFDPIKEKIQFVPLWIRILWLPLEMWNDQYAIGNLIRIGQKSKKVSK